MAIHVLQRTQIVRSTLAQCWDFFSNPRNLAAITPKDLDFQVLSDLPEKIYAGMLIEYRVRPLLGIPVTWLTEITHVRELEYFSDEQRVGPYRIWHHEHTFHDLGDGRIGLRDLVHYVLPFSPLSEPFHSLLVEPQLEKIFRYREQAVREKFGG